MFISILSEREVKERKKRSWRRRDVERWSERKGEREMGEVR